MSDLRLGGSLFRASLARYDRLVSTGPFHRKRSRTQTLQDDVRQIRSGLLWGRVPRGGKCPTVQAYFGPLPLGATGIEFVTPVQPHQVGLPAGFGANWYHDDTAFTGLLTMLEAEFAVITILVTRHQP